MSSTNHLYSRKDKQMNKENIMATNSEQPNVRITRARAKSLGTLGGLPPLKPLMNEDQNKVAQLDSKRAQPDSKRDVTDGKNAVVGCTAFPQRKKRAVLQDVTNIGRNKSNIKGGRVQVIVTLDINILVDLWFLSTASLRFIIHHYVILRYS